MNLRFETPFEPMGGKGLPRLIEADRISPDTRYDTVLIDDHEAALDDSVVHTFTQVVSRMSSEALPDGHYRDCVHFVMAMSDIWLPTSRILDRRTAMTQRCDDTVTTTTPIGPVSTGIPNDSRCIGFGTDTYVYMHAALGVTTDQGNLYLQKLGTDHSYGLSTIDELLAYYDHEVVHPILELEFTSGTSTIAWHR